MQNRSTLYVSENASVRITLQLQNARRDEDGYFGYNLYYTHNARIQAKERNQRHLRLTQKQMSKDIQTSSSTAKSRHTLSIIRNFNP